MFRIFVSLLLAVNLGSGVSVPVRAQTPSLAEKTVREINSLVERNYVIPEKASEITARLSASLAAGRYDGAAGQRLAELLTEDFLAASNDKHMFVQYNPQQAQAIARTAGQEQPDDSFFRNLMRSNNHGIVELKVLPGNVRYMNLTAFFWDEAATPKAYDTAMAYLADGDAIIIDLRQNGGGDSEAVRYLVSHFMDPDKLLMTFHYGPNGREESRSRGDLPVGRLPSVPLYVLSSPGSASAAEEFLSHAKHFSLGKIIGSMSAGAGHNNELFPVGDYVVSISFGRAIHAVTNEGWEATGIAPDVVTDPAAALDTAQLDALRTLAAKAAPEQAANYRWAMDALQAKLSPLHLSDSELAEYTGSFAGRTILIRDSMLHWRNGNFEAPLMPMSKDLFAIGQSGNVRAEFVRENGAITGVRTISPMSKGDILKRETAS